MFNDYYNHVVVIEINGIYNGFELLIPCMPRADYAFWFLLAATMKNDVQIVTIYDVFMVLRYFLLLQTYWLCLYTNIAIL